MAEQSSAIFWVLNCPIYLLRCYRTKKANQNLKKTESLMQFRLRLLCLEIILSFLSCA